MPTTSIDAATRPPRARPAGPRRVGLTFLAVLAAVLGAGGVRAGQPLPPPCGNPLPAGPVLHQFNGATQLDRFGYSVAFGDVNGDGMADIIVGAEWGTLPGTPPGSGYVRVHDGVSGAVLAEVNGSCDFGDRFNGDHLGFSLAVHDVNGDGKVNILTGAPDGDSTGLLDNGFVRLYQDLF